MKQIITPAQLLELNSEQQEKLRAWWKPQYNDAFIFTNSNLIKCVDSVYDLETVINKDSKLPLLSIGQMIEILEDVLYSIKPVLEGDILTRAECWNVWINKDKDNEFWGKGKELIDALWEAVKSIL